MWKRQNEAFIPFHPTPKKSEFILLIHQWTRRASLGGRSLVNEEMVPYCPNLDPDTMPPLSVSSVYHNKIRQPGWWLTQQKFFKFWRLEVQDQGTNRVGLVRLLSLECRWLPFHCALAWALLCVLRAERQRGGWPVSSVSSSSCKSCGIRALRWWPHLASTTSFKALFPSIFTLRVGVFT